MFNDHLIPASFSALCLHHENDISSTKTSVKLRMTPYKMSAAFTTAATRQGEANLRKFCLDPGEVFLLIELY